jgi:hypothetical protein
MLEFCYSTYMKKYRKLAYLILVILILCGSYYWYSIRKNNNCDAIACPSGNKCVAPNDALVDCEKLRQNPVKTDWVGS